MTLERDKALRRAENLSIEIRSNNEVDIRSGASTQVRAGPRALVVLDVFHEPTTFSAALERLSPLIKGAQDWMELTTTIIQLHQAGFLKDAATPEPVVSMGAPDWGLPQIHVAMLNDRGRTTSFIAALERVVREGDVVVDIGTGTGILALAAAQAGAKRVYAIEASGIGSVAQKVFELNDVGDKATVIEGWSTHVDLPERADVMVAEIVGSDPLRENILETTLDARKRLLKPNARFIPTRLRVFGLPVSIPLEVRRRRVPTPQSVDSWKNSYGADLEPLLAEAGEAQTFFERPQSAREWPQLAEPLLLADIDLSRQDQLQIETQGNAVAREPGELNGILTYFELELAPGVSLSTNPADFSETNHWRNVVTALMKPVSVQEGDALRISFTYRVAGKPTGVRLLTD